MLAQTVLNTNPFLQVNHQEVTNPNQPLTFGDFVEVVPCERPKQVNNNVAPWYSGYKGYHLFPKPQMRSHKHRPPVEQQRQQLNSMYKLENLLQVGATLADALSQLVAQLHETVVYETSAASLKPYC